MIKKENGKYVVYSESGRKFGSYDTKEKAKARIRQMEMFKHMKKTAARPKLKSIFASEPNCKVLGYGDHCVGVGEFERMNTKPATPKNFSKKAEYVFKKTAIAKTYFAIMKEIKAAQASRNVMKSAIKASSGTNTKALENYMKKDKNLLDKINRLKSQITN